MVTVALVVATLVAMALTWKKKKKRKGTRSRYDKRRLNRSLWLPLFHGYDGWLFCIWIWNARAHVLRLEPNYIWQCVFWSGTMSSWRCSRNLQMCCRVTATMETLVMVMVVASSFREERTAVLPPLKSAIVNTLDSHSIFGNYVLENWNNIFEAASCSFWKDKLSFC